MFPAVGLTPLDLLTRVNLDPGPIVFVVATAAAYALGVRGLNRQGEPWPTWKIVSYALGELCLVFGTISGLTAFDRSDFLVQAVQYSLVGMIAPILFALASPVTLAVRAGGPRTRKTLARLLRGPLGRFLATPVMVWVVYAVPLFLLYIGSLSGDGVGNDLVDQAVYLMLLVTGYAFCWAPIGIDPLPRRLGYWYRIAYVACTLLLYSILGMALESQSRSTASDISLHALQSGGGVAWTIGETIGFLGVIAIFTQWLRDDERNARRSDKLSEQTAEEQLAHWRAARDAAARAIRD